MNDSLAESARPGDHRANKEEEQTMGTNEILDRTSRVLTAERVFAPASVQNGITVIPAAHVRGGGGAGGGKLQDEEGEGGGFGVSASPAGAIVIDGHNVKWKVPFDLNRVILGGQVVGIAFFFFHWLTERSKARVALKIALINVGQ
jgi:uncharacterized spore protein YtfJ